MALPVHLPDMATVHIRRRIFLLPPAYLHTRKKYDPRTRSMANSLWMILLLPGLMLAQSPAPRLFFSDLDSGPNSGGENNNGAYVTLYGANLGANPTVTVGGGQALIKVAS